MQLYSQLLFLQNKGLMECLRPEMHSKLELVSFSLALPSIKKVNCIALTKKNVGHTNLHATNKKSYPTTGRRRCHGSAIHEHARLKRPSWYRSNCPTRCTNGDTKIPISSRTSARPYISKNRFKCYFLRTGTVVIHQMRNQAY